jgi:hypothetical protein
MRRLWMVYFACRLLSSIYVRATPTVFAPDTWLLPLKTNRLRTAKPILIANVMRTWCVSTTKINSSATIRRYAIGNAKQGYRVLRWRSNHFASSGWSHWKRTYFPNFRCGMGSRALLRVWFLIQDSGRFQR